VQAQPGCIVHRDKGARVHDDLHQAHHEVIDASAMASRLGATGHGQDDALPCGQREGIHCHDSKIKVSCWLGIVDKANHINDKVAVPVRSEGDSRAQDVELFHGDLGKAPSDAGVVKVQAQPGCIVHRDKGARVHDDLRQAHHEVGDASAMASRLGASGLGQDDALSCGKREGIHCHDSNIKVSGRLGIVDKAKDAPFLHDRSLTSSGSACSPATLACQRRHSSISADISSAEGASTVCPHVSIRFFW